MNGLKIAVIGGGSSYTPELMEGFITRQAELPLAEVRLVDLPTGREKVEIIAALARRMLDRAGLAAEVTVSYERRRALAGVDFVVSQFRVGGLAARVLDERIPLAHGIIGQETTGPGGFFKALRTIPVILDLCREMAAVAPDAWLINFTNPSGILAEAILRHGRVRSLGLCNVPINMHREAAKLLGVDSGRVFLRFSGLNHLVWARVFLDGVDVTPRVLAKMSEPTPDAPAIAATPDLDLPYDRDFLLALGYMPNPYHRYYYLQPEMLAAALAAAQSTGTRAEVVQRAEAELFELYRDPNLATRPAQLALRGGAHYSEAAVSLISAIHNHKQEVHAVGVRNGAAMPDLPPDAAVELSALVGRSGAVPLQVGPLPPQIRGLLQAVKAYEELTVQAAVSGDPQLAVQALAANHFVPSVRVARTLWQELLHAHRQYLPQFRD